MTTYTCFICGKKVSDELRGKRIRCPYCGSKVLYKSRQTTTKVKAI
ncbi:DNA-directed RNA polymerase subunit P [Candidatus Woesearchaeota archaeon]|nr:MAG: DNA-directed RNA polymerase subunit P [Candidatus Woesearchaeota archaeon]